MRGGGEGRERGRERERERGRGRERGGGEGGRARKYGYLLNSHFCCFFCTKSSLHVQCFLLALQQSVVYMDKQDGRCTVPNRPPFV